MQYVCTTSVERLESRTPVNKATHKGDVNIKMIGNKVRQQQEKEKHVGHYRALWRAYRGSKN
jgi:hypothetical protein